MLQPDIIMFSLPRWDQPISSPALSLAKEFSKRGRVFYIEHPFSIKDLITLRHSDAIKKRRKCLLFRRTIYHKPFELFPDLTIVYPSISLPINFLPHGYIYTLLSKFNDRIIFNSIRKVINEYHVTNWIYFNSYNPFFARFFPDDLKPTCSVYQSMDDISQEAYTAKHGLRLEEEIIRNYDIVLTTSKELTRLKTLWNVNTFFHPNAADISLFEKATRNIFRKPDDIFAVNNKIVGFTGSVEYRTDFELLKKLIQQHIDKTFVIVGPVFAPEIKEMKIDKFKNVIFTGPKSITELPAYLQFMDVVIIPYKCNTLTKSIYPLKINEYLGAGKPVITTNFSEDIAEFKRVTYIASTHEEFISMVDRAINENSNFLIKERQHVAAQNTWEVRVKQFWSIISRFQKS